MIIQRMACCVFGELICVKWKNKTGDSRAASKAVLLRLRSPFNSNYLFINALKKYLAAERKINGSK